MKVLDHQASAVAHVRLLGAPEWNAARDDGQPRRFVGERIAQLLAYLAWSGQWVTREQLAELFWPEHPATGARRNVRKLLFRLRERGGPPGLEDDGEALRWRVETDVAQLLQAAEHQQHGEVLALYRGPFLQGLEGDAGEGYAGWLAHQRQRFAGLWRHALLASMAGSSSARRRALAEALLAVDPFDEAAVLALAAAQRELGDPAEAARTLARHCARLKAELGIEPSAMLRQYMADGASPPAQRGPMPPAGAPPLGAPLAPGDFIGRRQELAELHRLLAHGDCRWLTVLGTGGIGKSRLLREAVAQRRAAADAPDTVWLSLADLRDVADLYSHLGAALGMALPSQERAFVMLTAAIGQRPLLLVLDDGERLDGWVDKVQALLSACPGLKLAVGSRRRTHASGEWVLPLDGLPLPDADSRDLEAAAHFDAVALFALRARQAGAQLHLAEHLPAVLDILAAVDGMPLGIELAAAWARALTPEQIAAELGRSPALLSGVGGRSLDAVFEGSWALLSAAERSAFVALSVFSGSFSLGLAIGVSGLPAGVFAALLDKCMVQVLRNVDAPATGQRLAVHPLLRHYAQRRAEADPPALAALEIAHLRQYAAWFGTLALEAAGERELQAVAADLPNLELAAHRAVRHGLPAALRPLVVGLSQYARRTNRMSAAVALFDSLLAQLDAAAPGEPAALQAPALRSPVLAVLADLRLRQTSNDIAADLARRGIRDARRSGDTPSLHLSAVTLAYTRLRAGDPEGTLRIIGSVLAQARRRHDLTVFGRMLSTSGSALLLQDRPEEAMRMFEEAHALVGDPARAPQRHVVCLNDMARVCLHAGDAAGARRLYDAMAEFILQNGSTLAELRLLLINGGLPLLELGELAMCRQTVSSNLASLGGNPNPLAQATAVLLLARADLYEGQFESARRGLLTATRMFRAIGMAEAWPDCLLCMGLILAGMGRCSEAAELLARVDTNPALTRPDRRRAAQALAGLGLAPAELAALRERTAAQPLAHWVDRILGA